MPFPGYSAKTLPRFIASMRAAGRRCDLVLIDGDHGFVGTRNDLKSLRDVAAAHTAVVVDDVRERCPEPHAPDLFAWSMTLTRARVPAGGATVWRGARGPR